MRQVAGFLNVISDVALEDFYTSLLSYGTIHGAKLPSFSEFVGANSNQDDPQTTFDEKTDKLLEAQAIKRLEERRKNLGNK